MAVAEDSSDQGRSANSPESRDTCPVRLTFRLTRRKDSEPRICVHLDSNLGPGWTSPIRLTSMCTVMHNKLKYFMILIHGYIFILNFFNLLLILKYLLGEPGNTNTGRRP